MLSRPSNPYTKWHTPRWKVCRAHVASCRVNGNASVAIDVPVDPDVDAHVGGAVAHIQMDSPDHGPEIPIETIPSHRWMKRTPWSPSWCAVEVEEHRARDRRRLQRGRSRRRPWGKRPRLRLNSPRRRCCPRSRWNWLRGET